MTTEQKVELLKISLEITGVNSRLLELAQKINDVDPGAVEVVQAGTKLIQAQNNILKAVNQ